MLKSLRINAAYRADKKCKKVSSDQREGISGGLVSLYQQFNDMGWTILGTQVKWSQGQFGFCMHKGIIGKQDVSNFFVPLFSSQVERGLSFLYAHNLSLVTSSTQKGNQTLL